MAHSKWAEEDKNSGVATVPPKLKKNRRIKPRSKRLITVLPPWNVILHNDDVNYQDYVVKTLMELVPDLRSNRRKARKIMREADKKGKALVVSTHEERAQLYEQQFTSRRLTVSIERNS